MGDPQKTQTAQHKLLLLPCWWREIVAAARDLLLLAARFSNCFTPACVRTQTKSVLADAVLAFRLLKVGGFLIFDDMKLFPGVERATAAVIEALGSEIEVLHNEVRHCLAFMSSALV